MPHYSTGALFLDSPSLVQIGSDIIKTLGPILNKTIVRLIQPLSNGDAELYYETPESACAGLLSNSSNISEVSLWNENHQFDLSLSTEGLVHLACWDFSSELYSQGLITADLQNKKKELIVQIHQILLKNKALFTFSAMFDNKYGGDISILDLADQWQSHLKENTIPDFSDFTNQAVLFWLIGHSSSLKTSVLKPLVEITPGFFKVIEQLDSGTLLEYHSELIRPYFLTALNKKK
jgi:hypothetical protein